ncbi:hypothetical protein BDW59DRAFT_58849 [Aspergillus cavernicola]|uniref:Uncharacterized protein n=1 Tax=Aspergillus cavernicola TaxID=176166 RepID=A0ABR4H754_9EURO
MSRIFSMYSLSSNPNFNSLTISPARSSKRVFYKTASGALETAPIAPPACRVRPPAANGDPIARDGKAVTYPGIASTDAVLAAFIRPPAASTHLYNPDPPPSTDHALSLLNFSLRAIRARCTAPLKRCRVIRQLPCCSKAPPPPFFHFLRPRLCGSSDSVG